MLRPLPRLRSGITTLHLNIWRTMSILLMGTESILTILKRSSRVFSWSTTRALIFGAIASLPFWFVRSLFLWPWSLIITEFQKTSHLTRHNSHKLLITTFRLWTTWPSLRKWKTWRRKLRTKLSKLGEMLWTHSVNSRKRLTKTWFP